MVLNLHLSLKKMVPGLYDENTRMKGVLASRSEEAIKKKHQTYSQINHQKGLKNSQYGTIWITDGVNSKKLKLSNQVPEGWVRGRLI